MLDEKELEKRQEVIKDLKKISEKHNIKFYDIVYTQNDLNVTEELNKEDFC